MITVNPGLPAKNLHELLALAREKPGKLNFGSTSQGGSPHMSAELLKMMARVDLVHVPYKGGGPDADRPHRRADPDGLRQPAFVDAHIKSGKVRALAVTTTQALARRAGNPDGGRERRAWLRGLGLVRPAAPPAGTPKPVIVTCCTAPWATSSAAGRGEAAAGARRRAGGEHPDAFGRQIAGEVEKWKKVVAATGVKAE